MEQIAGWIRKNFPELVLVGAAGGFLMILAELIITDHLEGTQLVAVVASVIGLVVSAVGFLLRGAASRAGAILLVLLSISGLVGAFEHYEEGQEEATATQHGLPVGQDYRYIDSDEEDEESVSGEAGEAGEEGEEGEEGEAVPPPLAPLSLSGLALLGAMAMLARSDAGQNTRS